ncbi:L-histidine N(alpha)-methyltransferase [Terriglobus tenax]|uniref:L-histidine N(alpha)-methyltransferase n=1 Tax=Terriglobus tenax TaxID=1111115 RepID=UPI0021E05117|nr:L-histidine N(alpha)-methyltransferase [Terriglobus tenax]
MSAAASVLPVCITPELQDAIACEVRNGLFVEGQKSLSPWLFYDEAGSALFERITELPEYYPTRTERALFGQHGAAMIAAAAGREQLAVLELGAGTATKTGILLEQAVEQQGSVRYIPVDVSASALDEACALLERDLPGVHVVPMVRNYVLDPLQRPQVEGRLLALYIGSSIGNFSPEEARAILRNLASILQPGDALLLGTDMVKDEKTLIAAYNDAAGVTAQFNLNVLHRLNRDLGANFDASSFRHIATWNPRESRIEMHLQALRRQTVAFPSLGTVEFEAGETIHTENSYKFTEESLGSLLADAGFHAEQQWRDRRDWFAVTLARL